MGCGERGFSAKQVSMKMVKTLKVFPLLVVPGWRVGVVTEGVSGWSDGARAILKSLI